MDASATASRPTAGAWLARHARDLAPVATLFALVVFFSLTAPGFFSLETVTAVLRQAPVRAIAATGLTFVLLCGEIDLSVAMVATFSACQLGTLHKFFIESQTPILTQLEGGHAQATALGLVVVLLVPVLVGLAIGVLNGSLTVWSRLPSFIITLAMMEIAYGLASYLTKSQQSPVPPALNHMANRSLALGGFELPWSAVVAGTLMLVAHIVLTYTRFGRYVYMVGGNREAARLAGVRTGLIVASALAISGVAAALGGLMNAGWLNSAGINQNEKLLLEAVACVVLGGTSLFGGEGGMKNTVAGVLAFTVLQVGLLYVTWVDEFLRRFVMGVVLLAALLINGQLAKLRRD